MTVYKRTGKRAGWYFMARTRDGRVQLASRTKRRRAAESIATMWNVLADERAWDLCDPVVNGDRGIGALYDLWCETEHDLAADAPPACRPRHRAAGGQVPGGVRRERCPA